MTPFDEQYGEGSLASFLDLFPDAPEVTSDTAEAESGGQLNLRFSDESKCVIGYSSSCWDFLLLESNGSGLLDSIATVAPHFAEGVGVSTFRCRVLNEATLNIFRAVGFVGDEFGPSAPLMELPIATAIEYGDWVISGKQAEDEPTWRRALNG